MKRVKITWIDQDASVLDLGPAQLLSVSAQWSASRPSDEPWLAVTKPISRDGGFSTLSLSLDAFHRFSDEVVRKFGVMAEDLLTHCTQDEIGCLKHAEERKGNPPELFQAHEGLLRIHLPSRLVGTAKNRVSELFGRAQNTVMDRSSID